MANDLDWHEFMSLSFSHHYEILAKTETLEERAFYIHQAATLRWDKYTLRNNALEMLHNHEIDMVVNIPKNLTSSELSNGYKIRRAAIDLNVPLITNSRLASAFIYAFCTTKLEDIDIKAWGEYK